MSTPVTAVLFFAGAAVSLGASWVLVSRIERIGNRLGASEGLLGLLAALAADAPEITSAVSALLDHRGAEGAGVVIGSNVFNLAALLGLGSIVAGTIALHRRVVLFQGFVAAWVAVGCLLTVIGVVAAPFGLLIVAVALVPYIGLAAVNGSSWWRRPTPSPIRRWLTRAVAEEELELSATTRPERGRPLDVLVAAGALVAVIVASVVMERSATRLGVHFAVPGIVVGGIVLAAVTSLPNAVAAIYWANRGRGVAMLSTGLNSNAVNVAGGFLVPAVLLGLGHRTGHEALVGWWYVGLTALVLAVAFRLRGLRRPVGWLIVAAYLAFVAALVVSS